MTASSAPICRFGCCVTETAGGQGAGPSWEATGEPGAPQGTVTVSVAGAGDSPRLLLTSGARPVVVRVRETAAPPGVPATSACSVSFMYGPLGIPDCRITERPGAVAVHS